MAREGPQSHDIRLTLLAQRLDAYLCRFHNIAHAMIDLEDEAPSQAETIAVVRSCSRSLLHKITRVKDSRTRTRSL